MGIKRVAGLLAVVVLLLGAVVPAGAITYGEPDGNEHPYVGLVGFYDAAGAWIWRCSGTLISPTVLLTAGHCTSPDADLGTPARAQVWFDSQIIPQPGGYPDAGGVMGTPVANPNFVGLSKGNTNDIGVVVLDDPVNVPTYGLLPAAGYLDHLATERGKQDVTFTAVGYGRNEVKPHDVSLRTRYKAVSHLVTLRSALTDGYNLQTSNNPGHWVKGSESGGTCFGDSGGPVFYSNTNLVVGITSFGMNNNCKGADWAYRTDSDAARAFLDGYVALP